MKKYDEIMNKIEVDEAMHKRILSYVENLNLETEKAAKRREDSKIRQFRRRTVRNITAAAACIAILLVCIFAWPKLTGPGELETKESVSIENGMVEVKSIDELSAAVGFPVNEVEELPFTVEKEIYTSYWERWRRSSIPEKARQPYSERARERMMSLEIIMCIPA